MSQHLVIDRIRCDGRGLCADLVPELIRLDDWGYPVVDPEPVHGAVRAHAARAVSSCPVLALRLASSDSTVTVAPPAARSRARR